MIDANEAMYVNAFSNHDFRICMVMWLRQNSRCKSKKCGLGRHGRIAKRRHMPLSIGVEHWNLFIFTFWEADRCFYVGLTSDVDRRIE